MFHLIIKEYIKKFESLGLGMFVHFGLYSIHAKGEWAYGRSITPEDYAKLFENFSPDEDWAENLVLTAKKAGCKYITLTTRHHEGFSLYDTCGLSDYDAPHSPAGRDLVLEFVNACNKHGIIPFFYHTLVDWHEKSYREDFPKYLKYLRASVELLCKNYGKIGGFWFDGTWDRPDADWEEDELYSLIRKYQPDAMIINNSGMSAHGAKGHHEIDSVTFERGRPRTIHFDEGEKHVASEMCQVLGNYWGYAKRDFNFKSLPDIIEDLCTCRRYRANLLLNVGPMGNGRPRVLERAMMTTLGEWVDIYSEALFLPTPTDVVVEGREKEFLLRGDGCYYFFAFDLFMEGDAELTKKRRFEDYTYRFRLPEKIKEVKWLDNGESVPYTQDGNEVSLVTSPQKYGEQLVVKIAKIIV